MKIHDAFRGSLPMTESSGHTDENGDKTWEIRHDVARGRIVIEYTADVFLNRREIDIIGSVLQMHLHELARKIHGRERGDL